MHVLQIRFLFNVHFDSLKKAGKRKGIITVVINPMIVPEKLKYAELRIKFGSLLRPKGLNKMRNAKTHNPIGNSCFILREG
jgi:hypothetical protein